MESSIVLKSFRLLETVAASPGLNLTELARRLELSKPTTHRVLGELRSLGYVQRTSKGTYQPAAALWRLVPGGDGRLIHAAEPVMRKLWLRTHETINLGVLRGQNVEYLRVFNSNLPLRRDVNAGDQDPALTTALGRALISLCPASEQAPYLENLPQKLTPKTLTTKRSLQSALRSAADKGFAVDSEETDLGVLCVAAPIVCGTASNAALSISLPTARLESRGGVERLGRMVVRASAAIAKRLADNGQAAETLPVSFPSL